MRYISTHALLAEGDFVIHVRLVLRVRFQPTPSLRRATYNPDTNTITLSISTHALLAEGDGKLKQ